MVAIGAPIATAPVAGAPPAAPAKKNASAVLGGDERIQHALSRLGFGARPGDVERVRAQGLGAWIDDQLRPESLDDSALEADLSRLRLVRAPASSLVLAHEYDTSKGIKILMALGAIESGGMREMGGQAARPKRGARGARAQAQMARLASRRGRDRAPMGADGAMNGEMGEAMEAMPARPAAGAGGLSFDSLPAAEQAKTRLIETQARAAGIVGGDATRAVAELAWEKVARAAHSRKQLQEVLVDFWSNHFNVDVRKGPVRTLKVVDEREVIRPRVLGRFRDLLGASAKSPAMLVYLDNVRSVAPQSARAGRRNQRPRQAARRGAGINENYARELMELHTLGVGGGYTQKDVQEVARCLTGWSINRQSGLFQFNPRAHDNGAKVVLGRAIAPGGGQKDGEQVLDLLAAHPSTAKFLSRKLCLRLVGDEPPQVLVDRVAKKWAETQGDLRAVVAEIAYAPEFYARAHARSKIKSPFEFAVSSVRALGAGVTTPDARDAYGLARFRMEGAGLLYPNGRRGNTLGMRASVPQSIAQMGQPLFAYQAPTGYSEDSRRWVSSGALIARLNFALALAQRQVAHVQMPEKTILDGLSGDDHEAVLQRLDAALLGGAMTPATRATLARQMKPGTPADPVKLTALVLGSPEFQRR
jgi:uncharacterized protein (DUF1800 family)